MAGIKKNINRIRMLMILSETLLAIFMIHWLTVQFSEERDRLQKDLNSQYAAVQQQVMDSLIVKEMQHFPGDDANKQIHIGLKLGNISPLSYSSSTNFMRTKQPGTINKIDIVTVDTNYTDTTSLFLSAMAHYLIRFKKTGQGLNFFNPDTSKIKRAFVKKMDQNGWRFETRFIRSDDSEKRTQDIYLKSTIATDSSYNIAVSHFSWFLFRKIAPQITFACILLLITGASFLFAYRSLKEQLLLARIKNEFVSNISHELKTPISTVKVGLEALNNFNLVENPQVTREYLAMMQYEMNRLELLVNNTLNISVIEDGKALMANEKLDLNVLLQEAIRSVKIRSLYQHAEVTFNSVGNNFFTSGDKIHIEGVFLNILDNSLKYSNRDVPEIKVSIKKETESVVVTIADNGPGIPAEYIGRVFEKFFRVPGDNIHNVKGYGLGLNYASTIMQQHKGKISVSNLPVAGCVFTITFIKAS